MAIRVKILVRCKETGKEVETVALVNTGFETGDKTAPSTGCPSQGFGALAPTTQLPPS